MEINTLWSCQDMTLFVQISFLQRTNLEQPENENQLFNNKEAL